MPSSSSSSSNLQRGRTAPILLLFLLLGSCIQPALGNPTTASPAAASATLASIDTQLAEGLPWLAALREDGAHGIAAEAVSLHGQRTGVVTSVAMLQQRCMETVRVQARMQALCCLAFVSPSRICFFSFSPHRPVPRSLLFASASPAVDAADAEVRRLAEQQLTALQLPFDPPDPALFQVSPTTTPLLPSLAHSLTPCPCLPCCVRPLA